MKKFTRVAFFLVPVFVFAALGAAPDKKVEDKLSHRTVIVPQDNSPFKVKRNQWVRLTGQGIAGSTLVAKVDGPAKILAENSIVTTKGGHILIGVAKVEYEIKTTGKGPVRVKITCTPPQPNAEPTVKTYEFEVQ